ncbi:matrixin family metalloprotease [Hymenobacter jejuensis]|uniref:Matrixin family metalloprotease n=1 Tax=Hymenobacter jejuensis TaxID=2502781 RepID=A0A5B8A139_9BACT|nr:matrixin family metalloprotease [Hymenobacter jejuensis]QDA59852.1 matrixin family metalloprotease [Hymenobacter jejuensis]
MKFVTVLRLAASLLAVASATLSYAQTTQPALPELRCLMVPLEPERRAQKATLVVEGEVLDAHSFWNAQHSRIYTAHRVRVYKSFKGSATAELTALTEGGVVDLEQQTLTNTLALRPGQQGIFFLYPSPFEGVTAAGPAWAAYGSQQGFIRYDLAEATATEPFRQYPVVDGDFYAELSATTGQPLRELTANPALRAAVARRTQRPVAARATAPVVATLAPTTITAGTGSVLTITGVGFGNDRATGFVEFKNADDGGATYIKPLDTDYVQWTDTRIQVRVPSYASAGNPAGSGQVRVTNNDQLSSTSPTTITVVYALSNVQESTTKLIYPAGHINQNQTGGYTFHFDPTFAANTAASQSWQRALATWRCQTGMNWEVGTTRTKRGAEKDGENAVGFDQGAELPDRVLGRTTSYYSGCRLSNGTVRFYVTEIDMQFDEATNWQYGTNAPTTQQVDFESVAVHELGHAHQLAHLILPSAVMHYAVARGQVSRQISGLSDIPGGRVVLRNYSFTLSGCGPAAMLPAPLVTVQANNIEGSGSQVIWTTRDECFVNAFVVQRATSDTTVWQTLTTLPAGAATNGYRYLDAQAPSGLIYYRLRLRRPDGSFDTTAPIAVTDANTDGLQLYPNPWQDGPLRLQYSAQASGTLTARIYDVLGRTHGLYAIDYQIGLNILGINPGSLRAGWYILRWRDSSGKSGSVPFLRLNP